MSIACPRCGYDNDDDEEFCNSCEFPLAETATLIHGRYRMTKPYVFSSFRAVFEAEDIQDNNRVYSVREFLPQVTTAAERVMLQSHFESTMSKYMELSHKNLAGITNFFVEGNYFYVVYEFINGMDLTKYLEAHKIFLGTGYPEKLVSFWTLQMCDLMEYLHHGYDEPFFLSDFKPTGVVFRKEDENIVFIDMGLTILLQILGPHYLITEDFQAFRKSGGHFDTIAWDLFCLGNFMFYLLTGVDLIHAPSNFSTPLKNIRPDVSDEIAEIVTKAIGKNFRSGYNDVRDIRQDLRQKVSPLPLRAYDFYSDFVGKDAGSKKIEWRMFLGNEARTNCLGLPPKPPLHVKWKCKMKPGEQYFLTASGDFVYATQKEGIIYCVDHKTGEVDWKYYITKNLTTPGIASDDTLYYITPKQTLVSIEKGQSEFNWKLQLETSTMSSPTLYDDILFVALYNGKVLAVSASEGEVLTTYEIEGNVISSPIVYQNILYVTSLNKMICAIDIDSEELLWQYESEMGFSASPTLVNDIIFVGSHDGTLCAVNIETGDPLWTRNFRGSITQSVRATMDMIYFVTRTGKLTALDPARGHTIWKKELKDKDFEFPFCLGANMIYLVDSRRNLRSIDSFTGKDRHIMGMSHRTVSQIMIAHNQLYLVSSAGHLVAFA